MIRTFDELLDCAAREAWPLWRLVDELEFLSATERCRGLATTIAAIADELDRRLPGWRERLPLARN